MELFQDEGAGNTSVAHARSEADVRKRSIVSAGRSADGNTTHTSADSETPTANAFSKERIDTQAWTR